MKQTIILLLLIYMLWHRAIPAQADETFFPVQAIDTMKFSRDRARQILKNPNADAEIEKETKNIADAGATHIAISTPYDDEFIPVLRRWVVIARKHNLKVWFRGNFSGWENWFDYPRIDRTTHLEMTTRFLNENIELFEDGDIFVPCPECENGGPGDPRATGDVVGFRKFLIDEYNASNKIFNSMGKKVSVSYFSMNGDVARLAMDKETTKKLGGLVTIDHYVKTQDKLIKDVEDYAKNSEGLVVLGEFGAPIPDIHGVMTEEQQAAWVDDLLHKAVKTRSIVGLNYWTSKESSTSLWNNDGTPRKVLAVLKKYYRPVIVKGTITDTNGKLLDDVLVKTSFREDLSEKGLYTIPILEKEKIFISKVGYTTFEYHPKENTQEIKLDVVLTEHRFSLLERIVEFFRSLFSPAMTYSPIPPQ